MKVLLIVLGSLGALYAAFGLVQFVRTLTRTEAGSAYGTANITASVVPVCLGLIVAVACFQYAFRKPKKDKQSVVGPHE